MNTKQILGTTLGQRIIALIILFIIALLSITVVSDITTSQEFYRGTIESIDEKKTTVMGLTAATAAASTALATLPGDATTPIADQILSMSSYLMIIVCVLVLEKTLLGVMGYLSFSIFIPISCALLGINLFLRKDFLRTLAIKLIILAIVLISIIPLSIKIGDIIYEFNQTEITELTSVAGDKTDADAIEQSWFEKLKDGVTNIAEKAQNTLSNFIDAIAVFIITYCVIPIAVLIAMIGIVKMLFNITIPTPQLKKIIPKKKNDTVAL